MRFGISIFLFLIMSIASAETYIKDDWSDLSEWDIHIANGTEYINGNNLTVYKDDKNQTSPAYIQTRENWSIYRNVSFDIIIYEDELHGYTHWFHIFDDGEFQISILINGNRVWLSYGNDFYYQNETIYLEMNFTHHFTTIINETGFHVTILNTSGYQTMDIIDHNISGRLGGFCIVASYASQVPSTFSFSIDNLTIRTFIPNNPGHLEVLSHIWNITNTTASLTSFLNDTTNYSANLPGTWNGSNPYQWYTDELQPNITYDFVFHFWNATSETWLNITDTTIADPDPHPLQWDPTIYYVDSNVSITTANLVLRSNESVHATWILVGGPGTVVSEHIENGFTFRLGLVPDTDYRFNATFTNVVNGSTTYQWNFTTDEVPVNRWDPHVISANVTGNEPHSVGVRFEVNESTRMEIITDIEFQGFGAINHIFHIGSFLNLTPETTYEVAVRFTNAVYGNVTYNMSFTTIPEPEPEPEPVDDKVSLTFIVGVIAVTLLLLAVAAVPVLRPKRRRRAVWDGPPPEINLPEIEEFDDFGVNDPTLPWPGGTPDKMFLPDVPSIVPSNAMPSLAIQIATDDDLVIILERLKGDARMDVCEENQQVLRNVKDLEKRLRQLRDDRDIAPRKYEQMIRDVKDLKIALQNLVPLMERREWDV